MAIYKRGGCDKEGPNGSLRQMRQEEGGMWRLLVQVHVGRRDPASPHVKRTLRWPGIRKRRIGRGSLMERLAFERGKRFPHCRVLWNEPFSRTLKPSTPSKPGTVEYYRDGEEDGSECTSELGSPAGPKSTTNTHNGSRLNRQNSRRRGLIVDFGTLRRALNLAYEWGNLESRQKSPSQKASGRETEC